MKRATASALITVFLLAIGIYAAAHPHVRLFSKLVFEYEQRSCRGFWVEWNFDDYFSTSVISEYDKNRDGLFDQKEQAAIYNTAFINLRHYGFFVFMRKGKMRRNPDRVERFSAWQKDGRLYYRFYVPLKGAGYGEDFSVAIFDRSFYCMIKYCDGAVDIKQVKGEKPIYEIAINKEYPVYYNPLGAADDMTIYTRWRSGLQTAYPEEVRIFFKR